MTKLEAEAVADHYRLVIRVHYQKELEKLRALQDEAEASIGLWLDTKAYRKKGNDRPFIEVHKLHYDYRCEGLNDADRGTVARTLVKDLLERAPK